MYWVAQTTLCCALWSNVKQLFYQAVMQQVNALNGAAVLLFEDP
jgi:hypothetical protein